MIQHYLLISLIIFCGLFIEFWQDNTISKRNMDSWLALCLVSMFWLVALPLSIRELTKKAIADDTLLARSPE